MTDNVANLCPDKWRADAVRYRMLWRLVPSVNHKLAGSMQPVTMLAGIFARHLQRPLPDMSTLTKQVVDMQQACKTAVVIRSDVMTWFQPSETKWVSLAHEAAQCAWLLTAEIAIRSCSVNNQIGEAAGLVSQNCLRTMFMVSLFAILDNADGPVAIQLRTLPASTNGATIVVTWTPLAVSDILPFSHSGQPIGWADLQAVADDLGVGLQHTATQIAMFFTFAP